MYHENVLGPKRIFLYKVKKDKQQLEAEKREKPRPWEEKVRVTLSTKFDTLCKGQANETNITFSSEFLFTNRTES